MNRSFYRFNLFCLFLDMLFMVSMVSLIFGMAYMGMCLLNYVLFYWWLRRKCYWYIIRENLIKVAGKLGTLEGRIVKFYVKIGIRIVLDMFYLFLVVDYDIGVN